MLTIALLNFATSYIAVSTIYDIYALLLLVEQLQRNESSSSPNDGVRVATLALAVTDIHRVSKKSFHL